MVVYYYVICLNINLNLNNYEDYFSYFMLQKLFLLKKYGNQLNKIKIKYLRYKYYHNYYNLNTLVNTL